MRVRILSVLFTLAMVALSVAPVQAASVRAEAGVSGTQGGVEWQVDDTLFLAGRDISVTREVAGSLTATGEIVSLGRETNIKRDVWIAARRVAVEGEIGGELSIRAQDALINGHVKGDVSFYGVRIAFGPDARIDGNVNYYAAMPAEIDAGARIAGNMRSKIWDETMKSEPYRPYFVERPDRWRMPGYRLSWPGAILFGFIAGVVALAAPASALRLREAASAQPALAFLIGLIWLIGTPILAIISAVTIVGLPLAFIVILLWPLGVLAGLVVAIMVLGALLSGRMTLADKGSARLIIGVALATLLLWIGISLPAFGGFVWLAAVTFGVGALVLAGRARTL